MLRVFVSALVVAAATLCGAPVADASEVKQLSFGPKYSKIENGKLAVNDYFSHGGTTDVKKNFVRLTTDRQSKRGHIWSRETVNNDQIVAVLTYRIHGQGKKWFGDGIGVWFTHEKAHAPGDNHGFTDKYYGVGIVLDTFRNVEHKGGHKDITVQINDGTKNLDVLNDETKLGCDSAFRYHSGSASFDPVYSSSRIRVKIVGNHLTLEVDPRSDGKWTECFDGALPFSKEWLRKATIGISASTGSLADNHDIIKLQSFDDVQDYAVAQADAEVWTHNYSKDFDSLMDSSVCDQNCKITILQKFIANFHIESEHWFEELKERTQNTVQKLREKERQNHEKIEKLTQRMNDMMENKIGQKLADVKSDVQQKIATKVEGELVVASSSWRLPFFFLIVALAGAFGFAYQKYQKLVKNHLL